MKEILRVLLLVGVVVVAALILGSCAGWDRAAAERDNAAARLVEAEARVVEAKGEAEARVVEARSQAWQEKYMLWTTSVAMFLGSSQGLLVALAAILGAVCAGVIIRWLNRMEIL